MRYAHWQVVQPPDFGGGKFASGATSAAMGFLFNDVLHQEEDKGNGGSTAQEDHYARNAENDAYLKDHGLYDRKDLTVDEIRDAGEFGFKRAYDGENIYHRNGPGNENNILISFKRSGAKFPSSNADNNSG